jgi:NitT/TauT family transport system ATP-binding protein
VDDLLRLKLQDDVRRIHEARKLTTVLVTHNLHEAVYVSDRVLVMSPAPSRVLEDVRIVNAEGAFRNAAFRESLEFQQSLLQVSRALFAPAQPVEQVAELTK